MGLLSVVNKAYRATLAKPVYTMVGAVALGAAAVLVSPSAATAADTYAVKAGDTLSGIAREHHLSLKRLKGLNPWLATRKSGRKGLEGYNYLKIGDQIVLPPSYILEPMVVTATRISDQDKSPGNALESKVNAPEKKEVSKEEMAGILRYFYEGHNVDETAARHGLAGDELSRMLRKYEHDNNEVFIGTGMLYGQRIRIKAETAGLKFATNLIPNVDGKYYLVLYVKDSSGEKRSFTDLKVALGNGKFHSVRAELYPEGSYIATLPVTGYKDMNDAYAGMPEVKAKARELALKIYTLASSKIMDRKNSVKGFGNMNLVNLYKVWPGFRGEEGYTSLTSIFPDRMKELFTRGSITRESLKELGTGARELVDRIKSYGIDIAKPNNVKGFLSKLLTRDDLDGLDGRIDGAFRTPFALAGRGINVNLRKSYANDYFSVKYESFMGWLANLMENNPALLKAMHFFNQFTSEMENSGNDVFVLDTANKGFEVYASPDQSMMERFVEHLRGFRRPKRKEKLEWRLFKDMFSRFSSKNLNSQPEYSRA